MEPGPHHIRVEVETAYLEEQSEPRDRRFVFSYTITIHNEGEVAARLLTRHWIITDADGRVQEVRGDGVVGEKPLLKPGQAFEYTSWCMLATPHGSMRGTYQMVRPTGEAFDAQVAPFALALPYSLN
jgi:ApaG protein